MSKLFLSGVPTDADVKRLLEAFPDIKPGQMISYTEIALVIRTQHGASRFRTVTSAWRRTLTRTLNFVLEAVPGQGFRRCTEIERSKRNRSGWRQDQSRAARKVRDLARTDTREFDEREQKTHDHARRVLQAHVEQTATTVRELAPPAPQKQLPKRQAS
jgi:hypothetical protein